jgi:hypothetical protein
MKPLLGTAVVENIGGGGASLELPQSRALARTVMRISRSDMSAATKMSGSPSSGSSKATGPCTGGSSAGNGWEMLLRTGLVKQAAVEAIADQVWPQDDCEEGVDEDDGSA